MTHTHSGACLSVTHYVWHISSWTWHRCHVDNRLGNRLHLNEPKTSYFFRSPLVSRHHIWILYHLLKNIKWTNYNTHSLISIWLLLIILSIVLFVTDILFLDVIYGLLHHKYGHRDVMLTCSVEDMRVLMSYPLGYITDMAFVTSYRYVLWHSCLDVMSTLLHHRRVHHDVILTCYVTVILVLTSCPVCFITDMTVFTSYLLVLSQICLLKRHTGILMRSDASLDVISAGFYRTHWSTSLDSRLTRTHPEPMGSTCHSTASDPRL